MTKFFSRYIHEINLPDRMIRSRVDMTSMEIEAIKNETAVNAFINYEKKPSSSHFEQLR